MEASQIMEFWDVFKEYIPEKNKEAVANQFVDYLLNQDIDTATFENMLGYDPYVDEAVKSALEVIEEDFTDLDADDDLFED